MERDASRVRHVRQVGKPLTQGATGMLWTAAKVLTAASLVASVLPGQSRGKRRVSGILGIRGSLCLRFAVFDAGQVSSRDPRATLRQQRAGIGAAEVTGDRGGEKTGSGAENERRNLECRDQGVTRIVRTGMMLRRKLPTGSSIRFRP